MPIVVTSHKVECPGQFIGESAASVEAGIVANRLCQAAEGTVSPLQAEVQFASSRVGQAARGCFATGRQVHAITGSDAAVVAKRQRSMPKSAGQVEL